MPLRRKHGRAVRAALPPCPPPSPPPRLPASPPPRRCARTSHRGRTAGLRGWIMRTCMCLAVMPQGRRSSHPSYCTSFHPVCPHPVCPHPGAAGSARMPMRCESLLSPPTCTRASLRLFGNRVRTIGLTARRSLGTNAPTHRSQSRTLAVWSVATTATMSDEHLVPPRCASTGCETVLPNTYPPPSEERGGVA